MTETTNQTRLIPVDPQGIPKEMKGFKHWVVWRAMEKEDGKIDKVPYDPRSGRNASTTDSRTWATFPEALDAYDSSNWAGLGFVLSSGDPFVGIDIDMCRNPETGEIGEAARRLIASLTEPHVELSPSGTGLHAITTGKLRDGTKKDKLEIYGQERFLTMTGQVCDA